MALKNRYPHKLPWVIPCWLGLAPLCAVTAESLPASVHADSPKQGMALQATPQATSQPRRDTIVFKSRVRPNWFHGNSKFWYRNDLPERRKEFVLVDAAEGRRGPAFDHDKLAKALAAAGGPEASGSQLPFDTIHYTADLGAVEFTVGDTTWSCRLDSYECTKAAPRPALPATAADEPRPAERTRRGQRGSTSERSPNGQWTALIKGHNVFLRSRDDESEVQLSKDGVEGRAYDRLSWSPDSQTLVAFRVDPADVSQVHLLESTPREGGRAKLHSRPYPLPGDKFASYELNLFAVATKTQIKPEVEPIDFMSPRLRWQKDGHRFTYQKVDRGHQRMRLVEVDALTGTSRNIIDEKSETFIWTAHTENLSLELINWLEKSEEIIYVSESNGWRHLYLVDAREGRLKNAVTAGSWVVRGIDTIDEEQRQVWFRASGREEGEDPYLLHFYRVNFDGSGLTRLTEGHGQHNVSFSPDRKYLIDTYSRVDLPFAHTLRRVEDGTLVCRLETAQVVGLTNGEWQAPEVFVAKARDGKTDIWGIIVRPQGFDPGKKYPVIEDIYAGPQSSYVPKTFSATERYGSLTARGFVVVKMDGMGTANRSKAFHDVCWHNLKDAGFEDRILWMRAAAAKYPWMDLQRVGVYGTSAGGQNAAGTVLFHPEFYKVAVASCGCHDNRMDKASWNEQWMGYPVGEHYAASSNIDNAGRLRGKLLLIVGEMDNNVPPESTYRFVDALIKAGKDFDFVMVPGAGHGGGGNFGVRRRDDFFMRHLLGVEPPDRNLETARETESSSR